MRQDVSAVGRPGRAPSGVAPASTAPITGWDRARWAGLADLMLTAVRPYASAGHARLTLPGPEGGYGRAVDGLEGFARTFLLAGFRLAGEGGADPLGLAEWYAEGIAAGTDPASPDRWVRLDEHGQAKVEAASIALVLDLTRPWIWDRLDPAVQQRVVDYLAPAVGDDTYPRINWVWFRLVVQTFLRSVGGPHSTGEMAEDLATHDTFVREAGWLADGAERAFDHYAGWALHVYPTLWARMAGAADLAAPRAERDRALLDRYLQDAVALVGADGSPLAQGRSLTYRFAAAAPFWAGAIAEVPSTSPGLLRRAASGVVDHFVTHGVPDERGLLSLGWHHPWPRLAQSYSGPGSPYWASKGLLGLALPADHPAWTAVEEPLPVEQHDELRAVTAPGWLVSGTRSDGIVRVVNHGTDHAVEGALVGDSPLYARLGYSTATFPLLDAGAWVSPLDQTVALLDGDGRASHRAGWRVLDAPRVVDGVGVVASVAQAHWLDPETTGRSHGSGLTGAPTPAGRLTLVSLVRGPWEVRLVHLEDSSPAAAGLRVAGWPLAGSDTTATASGSSAVVHLRHLGEPTLRSGVHQLLGAGRARTVVVPDASPLADPAIVPLLDFPATPGWFAVLVELSGSTAHVEPVCTVRLDAGRVGVTWPDGALTSTALPHEAPGNGQTPPR